MQKNEIEIILLVPKSVPAVTNSEGNLLICRKISHNESQASLKWAETDFAEMGFDMKFRRFILDQGPYLSWAVSLVATLGSLYFSEVMKFTPCTLCWYQRILMYPLVIILGIAAVRKDYRQAVYVIPMAAVGGSISLFHYLTQKTSLFSAVADACGMIPCNMQYINWLGFITIPFLALTAFVLIILLQILILSAAKKDRP
jgi:disulfide bond formation protein DsbB